MTLVCRKYMLIVTLACDFITNVSTWLVITTVEIKLDNVHLLYYCLY